MQAKSTAQQLQDDCCSANPRVALHAMRLIESAREWVRACQWGDLDDEAVDTLGTAAIVRGINRHYQGGWQQFTRDEAI